MDDNALISRADLLRIVQDVREQFSREVDQGVFKRDLYQSVEALGGRDACDRIARALAIRIPEGRVRPSLPQLEQDEPQRQRRSRMTPLRPAPRKTA